MVLRFSFLVLIWALPLFAQEDRPLEDTFRDEIDVRLVELEVVVTDGNGRSVTGLSQDDFELRQGRKRLDITHFSAYQDGELLAPTSKTITSSNDAAPRTADERLYLALYIDHSFLEPGELVDVVRGLRAFLSRGLRPKDRVLLVEANHSLEIRHGFTSLHELIDNELGQMQSRPPRGRAVTEFPRLIQEIERVAQQGADNPSLSRSERPMMLKAQIDSFTDQNHQELAMTTHQLHRLIPAIAGLPGRKQILYVGGSLPTSAGQRLHGAWNTAFGPSSVYQQQRGNTGGDDDFGRLLNTEPEAAARASDTGDLFRQVADLANANGVKLHVLDTGGLRQSRAFISSRGAPMTEQAGNVNLAHRGDANRRVGSPQIHRMMAEITGGRSLINSREFDHALSRVADDLRTYYVLAFEPSKNDDALHDVRVRIRQREKKARGPRLEIRHQQAYRGRTPDGVAAARAVSALILGETHNPLRIALDADPPQPIPGKKNQVRLPLHILFPVSSLQLVADHGGHRGQLSIYLTSGDLEHGASQVQKTVVPLRFTEEELRRSLDSRIDYKIDLPVASDSRRLAVAVRDDLRPLTATAVLELLTR